MLSKIDAAKTPANVEPSGSHLGLPRAGSSYRSCVLPRFELVEIVLCLFVKSKFSRVVRWFKLLVEFARLQIFDEMRKLMRQSQ